MDLRQFRTNLVALTGVLFLLGAAVAFLTASYLQKGSIELFLSYQGADGPTGYANSVNPERLGVHVFGDYLLPRWQSELDSPWFVDDPRAGPLNNYLPFTMAFFWLFSHLPYWWSFAIFAGTALAGLMLVIWKSIEGETWSERTRLMTSGVLLTSPFVSLVDRGNIQFYLLFFLCSSLYLLTKGHSSAGAVLLGLAIALKGYPIFFLPLWLRARRWRDALLAICTAVVATLLPLLFYQGGVLRNISRIVRNVRENEHLYSIDSLAFNNSLKGTLLAFRGHGPQWIREVTGFAFDHFGIVAILITLGCLVLMFSRSIDDFGVIVVATCLTTTTVDYVGTYAVGTFFVVFIGVGFRSAGFSTLRGWLLGALIAVQLMPKGFPLKFWSTEPSGNIATYASVLGGTSSVLIVAVIVWECISRSRANARANPDLADRNVQQGA